MQPETNLESSAVRANSMSEGTTSSDTARSVVKSDEAVMVRTWVEVDSADAPARVNASTSADPSDSALQLAEDLKKFQALASELKKSLVPAASFTERCNQSFSMANDLFGHAPTWICFYREVLAVGGLTHQLFPTNEEHAQFITSSHYDQLQQMLTALRSRDLPENDPNDPQRMITVRLPKSLHLALCEEAGRLNISVNKLCISRLLQVLDQKMVPEAASKPRGRKPRTREEAEIAKS